MIHSDVLLLINISFRTTKSSGNLSLINNEFNEDDQDEDNVDGAAVENFDHLDFGYKPRKAQGKKRVADAELEDRQKREFRVLEEYLSFKC